MSVFQITKKVTALLGTGFTDESQVVYLMVETRKFIDHISGGTTYPVLKFYADWCVHTKKDKITLEIKALSEKMYAHAVATIMSQGVVAADSSPIKDFVYMEDLKIELKSFLQNNGLPTGLVDDKKNWVQLVSLLVKVLEEQPIINPCSEVKTISFEPANENCVAVTMVFNSPVGGYYNFTLKNVYR